MLLSRLYARVVDQRTGSGWRIPSLDGLRGIAATMVLVAHTRHAVVPNDSLLWAPIERGGLGGVVLFFALSGFLLYLPWMRAEVEHKPPPRFRHYAMRRCLRIMPAYYGSVIVLAILRVVVGGRDPLSFPALALHFLFLPTLMSSLQTVYWTLQVEEFFYWMLPLLHRLVLIIGSVRVLFIATLVSAGWGITGLLLLGASHRAIWFEQTPFFLPAFALGIVTAVRWTKRDGLSGRLLFMLGTGGYVAMAPLILYLTRVVDSDQITPLTEVLIAPAASAVVLGAARGGAPFLEHPVLRFLGAISFSVYLWHLVVIKVVPVPPMIANSFGLRLCFTVAVTLPVSLASYLCLERPFLLLRPTASGPTQAVRSA